MDPTLIGLAIAAIRGGIELAGSLSEPDLTPEQIAQKKAFEVKSRQFFDAYVAANPPAKADPED